MDGYHGLAAGLLFFCLPEDLAVASNAMSNQPMPQMFNALCIPFAYIQYVLEVGKKVELA